nr:uncharacterized protein LOC111501939 [Leptinotarsa decemlineata]
MTFITFLVLCACVLVADSFSDHYWIDWNGTLPSNAFVAGKDIRGKLYVVQAYVENYGTFVGYISENQTTSIINPCLGLGPVQKVSDTKILCTTTDSLAWIPSNHTCTPTILRYTFPVLGGLTDEGEKVYVGRYSVGEHTYIGNVHTNYNIYFTNYKSGGALRSTYDILIYPGRD